ncbi:MAG: CHASE3 domain-containing protein, partial [Acidobacteriaceae bacterium]|nr:CHASE3 domain-containing protein [Acidobacteriaceae bacterium]
MNLRDFNRVIRETLFLPILLLIALAAFAGWQIQQSSSALTAIANSDAMTAEINELQKLIIDQETGLRGYQLTSDPAMLAPFRAAAEPIRKHFDHLRRVISGRQDASHKTNELQQLTTVGDRYQLWLGFAMGVLNKDPAIVNDPHLNQRGKDLMDSVRAAIDALSKTETSVRRERSASALELERHEFATLVVA